MDVWIQSQIRVKDGLRRVDLRKLERDYSLSSGNDQVIENRKVHSLASVAVTEVDLVITKLSYHCQPDDIVNLGQKPVGSRLR